IILVRLSEDDVTALMTHCTEESENKVTVNLEAQTVTDEHGFSAHFEIDPFRKYCLLNGLDDIGLTLRHTEALDSFEAKHDNAFWSAPKTAA
ncbi:MAG: 3-isopropylmalate dehydratase small subunit, partial [Terriglobus sp.]